MEKFAVFDIDGTLIRWQLYHVIVSRLAKEGALGQNAQTELKEAIMAWKRREDKDSFKIYEKNLISLYDAALRSIDVRHFDKLVSEVIEEYKDQTYVYTRNLVKKLKKDGYKLFIISGSHKELIEQIAKYYGFDDFDGTYYERKETLFTGKNTIVPSLDKASSLKRLLKRNNVSLEHSLGVGDTSSDIPMLEIVEHAIAFNPDSELFDVAKQKGWKIVVERKNVIYKLEPSENGYKLLA